MKTLSANIFAFIKKCDLMLLAMAVATSCVGLLAVKSATLSFDTNRFLIVQGGAIVLGIIGFFVVSLIDFDQFGDFWPAAFVFNLAFLFSLVIFGTGGETTGNNSWIRFAGIGVQPAEVGKLIFTFTFARHIYKLRDRINQTSSVVALMLHALITAGFVFIFSDDLGMCIIYILMMAAMLFASGMSFKWLGPIFVSGCVALVPLWMFVLKDYHKLRVMVIFNPEASAKIAYNGIQSMIAVGGGQLMGYGYGAGPQTQFGFLPAKHTDFIFASFAEEWGFVGAGLLLLLLCIIVWRIFYGGYQCNDRFSYLVCVGLGSMMMFQIMINVGMCLGIMPVVGLTLPFVSYGGTSVLSMFLALGMVSSVRLRQRPDRLA